LAEELGGINYDWQLAGPPGEVRVQFFSCTGTLYCVLIARTQDPRKTGFGTAGEERKCQRTAEVTDPPLAVAAWES
jgi:hypothetical protein